MADTGLASQQHEQLKTCPTGKGPPRASKDTSGGHLFVGGENNAMAWPKVAAHEQETFLVADEDQELTLRLEKRRMRLDGGEAKIRYRFVVLRQEQFAEDSGEGDVS